MIILLLGGLNTVLSFLLLKFVPLVDFLAFLLLLGGSGISLGAFRLLATGLMPLVVLGMNFYLFITLLKAPEQMTLRFLLIIQLSTLFMMGFAWTLLQKLSSMPAL